MYLGNPKINCPVELLKQVHNDSMMHTADKDSSENQNVGHLFDKLPIIKQKYLQ